MTDTGPEEEHPQHPAQAFIDGLDQLDAGGRARLKRNAGRTLAEAHDVHRVFFQALPHIVHGKQRQEDYFLVATLFPLVPHNAQAGSLGASLHAVRFLRSGKSDGRMNSLDRRFQALLDSDREQLAFRLRQAVRLVAADRERVALDWEQLLLDVLAWEHSEHWVQLRWARDYFVGPPPQSTDTGVEANTTEPQGA